jgi:hypothetical protein
VFENAGMPTLSVDYTSFHLPLALCRYGLAFQPFVADFLEQEADEAAVVDAHMIVLFDFLNRAGPRHLAALLEVKGFLEQAYAVSI